MGDILVIDRKISFYHAGLTVVVRRNNVKGRRVNGSRDIHVNLRAEDALTAPPLVCRMDVGNAFLLSVLAIDARRRLSPQCSTLSDDCSNNYFN